MMKLAILVLLICSSSRLINGQRSRNAISKSPNCLGLLSTLSTANEGDAKYSLQLELGSKIYEPFERYSIILKSNDINTHFKEFNIIAESEEKNPKVSVGRFERYKEALTKYSDDCPNGVTQSSLLPKQEIKVKWIAPPSGSGCIRFRAAARSNQGIWITNSNSMSFVVCEENQLLDGQPKVLLRCTACDEAKYGVEITGLWSRNTHPVDYPKNSWDARLSDFIGASHSNSFRIFSKDEVASEPLRRLAEEGQSKYLIQLMNERERKNQIRTILKARGITHPLLNGKTFAEFRVDRDHHLMSLVAKLEPSPDWFVGVDSLELCSKNGSWIDEKQMNLYLYDAGTDGGSGYENANKLPLKFKEKIYQLTNLHPMNSPFYNLNDSKIKPFARVRVVKQRLFPSKRPCRVEEAIEEEDEPDDSLERNLVYGETNVSPPMFDRTNFRFDEEREGRDYNQENYGTDYNNKYDTNEKDDGREVNSREPYDQSRCSTTDYSPWSECKVNRNEPNYPNCGRGKARRSRQLINQDNAQDCASLILLEDEIDCEIPCRTGNLNYQTGNREGYYGGNYDENRKPPTRYRNREDTFAVKDSSLVNKNTYDNEDDRTEDNRATSDYNDNNNNGNEYTDEDSSKGGYDTNDNYPPNENGSNEDYRNSNDQSTSREPYYNSEEDPYIKVPERCKATDWSSWSSCFGECSGYRYRNRTRSLLTYDSLCLGMKLVEQEFCEHECPGLRGGRRGGRTRIYPRNVTPRMEIRSNRRILNKKLKSEDKIPDGIKMLRRNELRSNARTDVKLEKRNLQKDRNIIRAENRQSNNQKNVNAANSPV